MMARILRPLSAMPGLAALGILPLLFSSCDQGSLDAPASASAPVSFRLQGASGSQLPVTSIVQIQTWVDDTIRIDSQRFEWTAGKAALDVPLGRPLRFRLDGILRRAGRDVVVWTATGKDTLRESRREQSVVTLQWSPLDTASPDAGGFDAPAGVDLALVEAEGVLSVVLPVGVSRSTLGLGSAKIESLYVAGQPVPLENGVFTVPVARGDVRTLLLVGKNRMTTEVRLEVRSGDVTGPVLLLSADNGASKSVSGDTTIFTFPYVVDSTPHLLVGRADAADRIGSISFEGDALDAAAADWTIAIEVPRARPSGPAALELRAVDSLGNATVRWIRFARSPSTRRAALEWVDPPGPEPLGAHAATMVLKVVGGDSLLEPRFSAAGLNDPAVTMLATKGDTAWWQCSIALLEGDSGSVGVAVSNRLDSVWTLAPIRITRFDPRGADETAPTLVVASPSGGSAWIRTGAATRIEGRAFDERGGKVEVRVRIGSRVVPAAWSEKDSSWLYLLAWSGDGDTTLAIQAVDSAGNPTAERSVRLRRDTKPPVLSWETDEASRGDTVLCAGSLVRLALDVEDLGGAVSDVALVRAVPKDSLPAQADPLRAGIWNVSLDLRGFQGVSAWVLVATDSAGNRTNRDLVVLRDTIAPRIVRQQPLANPDSVSEGSSVALAFAITDAVGVDSVWIDGRIAAAAAGGTYAGTVAAPGLGQSKTIVVEARDRHGNRAVDSSLRIVTPIASPARKSGVAPGTTARDFFFDAVCPDAGASLQEYKGGTWASWGAPRFVAVSASIRMRCAVGTASSRESVFSWTVVDGSVELPTGLAAVADSAWAMATDSAGTLWIVTSKSKAWYWAKGDSAWHARPSPFPTGGRVEFGAGRAGDGATWVLAQNGSDYAIAAIKDTTITPVTQGTFPPAFLADGPIRLAVGQTKFVLAYLHGSSVTVQYGTNLSPQTLNSYPVVGFPVLQVAGAIPSGNGGFEALLHLGIGDSVGVVSIPSTFAYDPRNIPQSRLISARYQPRYIARLDDGSVLVGTSSIHFGHRGPDGGAGMIYRFSAASMDARIDSLPLSGLTPVWASSPGSSRVWIGNSIVAGQPPAEPVQVFPTAPLGARFAVTPHTSNGSTKIAATSWGSAWALMAADGLAAKLYRYHPR